MEKTELCHIMTKYGSDKGRRNKHNYTRYYSEIFGNIRNNVRNVFELGLGTNFTDVQSSMGPKGEPIEYCLSINSVNNEELEFNYSTWDNSSKNIKVLLSYFYDKMFYLK